MATPGADERFALLKQLFDLAQQQKAALDEEDVERFMHLLGEREPLLYALSGRDAEELPSNVVSINRGRPSDESSVDTETAIGILLRAVIDQDAENELLLRAKLGEVQDAITRVSRGAAMVRMYRQPEQAARGLDRKAS